MKLKVCHVIIYMKQKHMTSNTFIIHNPSPSPPSLFPGAVEPKATMIFNQFQPPLPRISKRDLVAMKLWIPEYISLDSKSGLLPSETASVSMGEYYSVVMYCHVYMLVQVL